MPRVRTPNSGPYVVSWCDLKGIKHSVERHTWSYACQELRTQLTAGHSNVSVSFV
jgi:hypothetical protein